MTARPERALRSCALVFLASWLPAHANAAEPDARVAAWLKARAAAFKPAGEDCASPLPATEPRIRALPAPPGMHLVEYPAGGGRGAHREHVLVRDGSVVDVDGVVLKARSLLASGDAAHAEEARVLLQGAESHPAVLVERARAAGRSGSAAAFDAALKAAREADSDGAGWRFAAAEQAHRTHDAHAAELLDACIKAVRDARLDDPRCYVLHASIHRDGRDLSITRQLLEEALGRSPGDPDVLGAQALLEHAIAAGGTRVDTVGLSRARLLATRATACATPDARTHAALLHVVAAATLVLGDGPCVETAARALYEDPLLAPVRETLVKCTECALLHANRESRASGTGPSVDAAWEGRLLMDFLLRDKVPVCNRVLPGVSAVTRGRASLRVTPRKMEVRLSSLAGERKGAPEQATARMAGHVYAFYRALYDGNAPLPLEVSAQWADAPGTWSVEVPADAGWSAVPSDKDIQALAGRVKKRADE